MFDIESNPGPLPRLTFRIDRNFCLLELNSNNEYEITDSWDTTYVISDIEPANYICRRDIIVELMVLCQRSLSVKPTEIINKIVPKTEKPFVVGKLIQLNKVKFYINKDHHISVRGKEEDIDLGILKILY